MKKLSYKNLSVLGLVVMGASAVVAMVIPAKSSASQLKDVNNGHFHVVDVNFSGPNDTTCIADSDPDQNCHDTISNNFAGPSFTSTFVVDDTSFTTHPLSNTTD